VQSPEEKTLQKFVELHPERRDEVINHMKQSLSPLVDKWVFINDLGIQYYNGIQMLIVLHGYTVVPVDKPIH